MNDILDTAGEDRGESVFIESGGPEKLPGQGKGAKPNFSLAAHTPTQQFHLGSDGIAGLGRLLLGMCNGSGSMRTTTAGGDRGKLVFIGIGVVQESPEQRLRAKLFSTLATNMSTQPF